MKKILLVIFLFISFISFSSCSFNSLSHEINNIIKSYNEEESLCFKNYLVSSFLSEVDENNGVYTFVYKNHLVKYQNKVNIYDLEKNNYDYLFDSFEEAKKEDLKVNDIVKTKEFFKNSNKGEGLYKIVQENNGLDIAIDNGLYARVINHYSIENFGGYGDNIHDDSNLINNIFNYKNDYKIEYLFFESKNYLCLNQLNMYLVNDLSFIGNNSNLVINNDYNDSNYKEFFLNISSCNNLLFTNLNINYEFTRSINGIKTQVGIHNSSNLEFANCKYNILNNYRDVKNEVTNFDCYQGWQNIIINKCEFNNLSDSDAGGSLWIRDFRNNGSKNIKVLNSSFHKIAHDEMIAVFQGNVEDVLIKNNKFLVEETGLSSSVMNFTFGSTSSLLAKNIYFINNEVNTIASGGLIWSCGDNVIIKDNVINAYISKYCDGNFRLFESRNNKYISLIENNKINLKTNLINNEHQVHVFNKVDKIKNNKIDVECKITDLFLNCNEIINNKININEADYVIYNVHNIFKDNELTINNNFGALFRFYGFEMNNNIDLINNIINYNYEENEDNSCLIMLNESKMNNYIISFNENKIFTKKINKKSRILFFYPLDENQQKMYYLNNEINGYENNHYLVNIEVISSLD